MQKNNIKLNIENQLLRLFKLIFKLKKKKEILNFNSKNNNKWDSLNHIKLMIYIEKNFNIRFGAEQYKNANSFKKILKYIIKAK